MSEQQVSTVPPINSHRAVMDFMNRRVVVFDTECTGLHEPSVISFAYGELDTSAHASGFFLIEPADRAQNPVSMAGGLFIPTQPMTLGAIATHGILPEDLLDCEEEFDFAKHVGLDTLLIGHQIDFDWEACGRPPVPRICTLAMAQRLWPELDSHKLTALMYFVMGVNARTREAVRNAHNAAADVMMTCTLLYKILEVRPDIKSWRQLWDFSEDSRHPRYWDFGKFGPFGDNNKGNPRGLPLHAADAGYIRWVRKTIDDKPYLLKALTLMEQGKLSP